ncbi:MAG: hypothetical protein R3C19_19225 [Planctomycetaceae bacterium]
MNRRKPRQRAVARGRPPRVEAAERRCDDDAPAAREGEEATHRSHGTKRIRCRFHPAAAGATEDEAGQAQQQQSR